MKMIQTGSHSQHIKYSSLFSDPGVRLWSNPNLNPKYQSRLMFYLEHNLYVI